MSSSGDHLNGAGDPAQALERMAGAPGVPERSGLAMITAADVEPLDVTWLFPGVPLAYITLIAGPSDRNKSTIAGGWVARTTNGFANRDPADVIVLAAEDEPATMLVPRQMAANADLSRIHIATTARTFPEAADDLEAAVEEHRAAMVLVDPATSFLDPGLSMHNATEVRQMMGALADIAKRHNCAVIVVAHLRKAMANTAANQVAGSTAWTDASRSAFYVDLNPEGDDPNERLLAHSKSNLAPKLDTAVVRVEEVDIGNGRKSIRTVPAGTSDLSAEDVMAMNGAHQRAPKRVEGAQAALQARLGDGEWHQVKNVRAALAIAGHSERTVTRAADALAVEKRATGFPAVHEWKLAGWPTSPDAETGQPGQPGRTRSSKRKSSDSPDRLAKTRDMANQGQEPPTSDNSTLSKPRRPNPLAGAVQSAKRPGQPPRRSRPKHKEESQP